MQLSLTFASFVLALGAVACNSATVSSNYDPNIDFSQGFHSYAWLPDGEMKDTGVTDPLTDKLLREAIDTEMAARGFTQASGTPEFFVAYHAAVESKLASRPSSSVGVGFGSGGYRGAAWGVSTNSEVYEYDEGTLVLDFLRAETRELAWRGSASEAVNRGGTREDRLKQARSAVRQILERFPPK